MPKPTLLLATLDDSGHLSPSSVHEARDVILIEGHAAARELLQDYMSGYTYSYTTADYKWHAEYGGNGHEPTLTVYICEFQASRSEMTTAGARMDAQVNSWRHLIAGRDPYPDYQLTVGPRGGIKRTAC